MSDRTPFHEQVRAALEADDRPARPADGSRDGVAATGTAKAARPSGSSTAAAPAGAAAPPPAAAQGSTRTARLRLVRLDPWSVMKTSFLLSIAFGIVTVVSVSIVWGVLGAAGVWDSINASVQQIVGDSSSFDIESYLGTSRVLGFTTVVAVVDVILITAIATLGAFLYNLSAALLGGLDVTLAEDDR